MYELIYTEKSHCPLCDKPVNLLQDRNQNNPQFYICFPCNFVGQKGIGPVTPLPNKCTGIIPPSVSTKTEDVLVEANEREQRVEKAISKFTGIETEQIISVDELGDVFEIGCLDNSLTKNPKLVVLDEFDPDYNWYLTSSLGFYIYAEEKETYDWAIRIHGEAVASHNYPRLNEDTILDVISYIEAGDRVLVVPKYGPDYVAQVIEKHREFYTNSKPNELLLIIQYYLQSEKNKHTITEEKQVTVKVRELDFLVKLENEIPPK